MIRTTAAYHDVVLNLSVVRSIVTSSAFFYDDRRYDKAWSGSVRRTVDENLLVDFLGFAIPYGVYCNKCYMYQPEAHAIRTRQCNLYPRAQQQPPNSKVYTAWPVVAEEYWEYADVMDAAADYIDEKVNRPFAFVELGAGYGHWAFAAHAALKLYSKDAHLRETYLFIDVLDTLKDTIEQLAALNDLPPDEWSFHAG